MNRKLSLAKAKNQFFSVIKDVVKEEEKEEREAIARAKVQVKKGKTVSLNSIKKNYDLF